MRKQKTVEVGKKPNKRRISPRSILAGLGALIVMAVLADIGSTQPNIESGALPTVASLATVQVVDLIESPEPTATITNTPISPTNTPHPLGGANGVIDVIWGEARDDIYYAEVIVDSANQSTAQSLLDLSPIGLSSYTFVLDDRTKVVDWTWEDNEWQSVTRSITPTFQPSATLELVSTKTIEAAVQASATITNTPTATITNTPIPPTTTNTPIPSPTEVVVITYYVNATAGVNARSCPQTSCDVVTIFSPSSALDVIGSEDGQVVAGTAVWAKVLYQGETIYVHSSLLTDQEPTPIPTARPQSFPTSAPAAQPVQPVAPPPVASGCDCNSGDTLNCSNFNRQSQAQACFNKCMQETGRDVHRLDGNDNDGLACESLP